MADSIYLLSSLPHFDLSEQYIARNDIISLEKFLEDCMVLGENKGLQVVEAVHSPQLSQLAISKRWAEYEYSIKNEIAKKRWATLRHGTYQTVYIHGSEPVTSESLDLLANINQEHNTYIREKSIILAKWNILENLDQEFLFSIENVIVYGWKLQVYQLYRNLILERGQTQWNTLLHTLANKAGFSISGIIGETHE